MEKKFYLLSIVFIIILMVSLSGCSNSEIETDTESNGVDSTYNETEGEGEGDSDASPTNSDGDNSNSQYVPSSDSSDNAEDYDAEGNYKPVESMTQDEIEAELESILEGSFGE